MFDYLVVGSDFKELYLRSSVDDAEQLMSFILTGER